jgi:hypothetical protein
MKFLQYLFLVAITLLGTTNQIFAQKAQRMYWQYVTKGKNLIVDGKVYKAISPSVYVNETDTLTKLQHPRKGNPILLDGYQLIGTITEPLAFKKSECTSWQLVDIYRKLPKPGFTIHSPKPDTLRLHDTLPAIHDSIYVDTGRVVYVMPVDTGGLWIDGYVVGDFSRYFKSSRKRLTPAIKIGVMATLWNGDKPADQKIDTLGNIVGQPDHGANLLTPKDSTENTTAKVVLPLLRNLRIVTGTEFGFERDQPGLIASDDTCFVCAEVKKPWQMVGDVIVGAQYAPRHELDDKQFQVSVLLEARYRYLGDITNIPNSNGWNRLSLIIGARADYGPFVLEILPRWTPGLGMGYIMSLAYDFAEWHPKKGTKASKLRLPMIKL